MRRVVILGRGGAGKSVLAGQLSELTGITAIELDGLFWQPGPSPTPAETWVARRKRASSCSGQVRVGGEVFRVYLPGGGQALDGQLEGARPLLTRADDNGQVGEQQNGAPA
jgi:hypothetical protein